MKKKTALSIGTTTIDGILKKDITFTKKGFVSVNYDKKLKKLIKMHGNLGFFYHHNRIYNLKINKYIEFMWH